MKRIVYRGEVYNRIEAARIKALKNFASSHYMDGYHDGLKAALQILANEVTDVSPQVYVDSLEAGSVEFPKWVSDKSSHFGADMQQEGNDG